MSVEVGGTTSGIFALAPHSSHGLVVDGFESAFLEFLEEKQDEQEQASC